MNYQYNRLGILDIDYFKYYESSLLRMLVWGLEMVVVFVKHSLYQQYQQHSLLGMFDIGQLQGYESNLRHNLESIVVKVLQEVLEQLVQEVVEEV